MKTGQRSSARLVSLALVLSPVLLSGCVGDEFFPEPFTWTGAGDVEGAFSGPRVEARETLTLPSRVDRIRLHVEVKLDTDGTARILTGSDVVALELSFRFSDGEQKSYTIESSRTFDDEWPGVSSGPVEVIALGRGQGSYAVHVEAHGPLHEDYAWYHPWHWE